MNLKTLDPDHKASGNGSSKRRVKVVEFGWMLSLSEKYGPKKPQYKVLLPF